MAKAMISTLRVAAWLTTFRLPWSDAQSKGEGQEILYAHIPSASSISGNI